MFRKLLVVHGPNLNLLGERKGDEKGLSLDSLDALLRARAGALGLELKFFQSNHEGKLIDFLHAERQWADGVLLNPGALTHYSYVLREAVAAIAKPTIEVHLSDIRRRESWRRKSVLKDVCVAQVMGKGSGSYLSALERFASGDLSGRKKAKAKAELLRREKEVFAARKPAAKKAEAARPAPAPAPKTLGRPAPKFAEAPKPAPKLAEAPKPAPKATRGMLSRALVRQKIADRLAGKLTPAGLATWARGQWLEVQRGAPAESGFRELLDDSLQSLTLSTLPTSRLGEGDLIELMAQLDG